MSSLKVGIVHQNASGYVVHMYKDSRGDIIVDNFWISSMFSTLYTLQEPPFPMMIPPFIASFNADKLKFFKPDMETTNIFSLAYATWRWCGHKIILMNRVVHMDSFEEEK